MSVPGFELSLLGGFRLTGPGGAIALPNRKLAGLLTYLACVAPRPQPREKLTAVFWGSHFDAQARQNLRQSLFRLRKVLGDEALESDGEGVGLSASVVRCDVGRFEALVREGGREALTAAVDLYRGPLADEVTIAEEGWNDWVAEERRRLLQIALGASIRLGELELAAGRVEAALAAGQRAVSLNNMREDAHRLVVRALAATGRKGEALKHYEDLAVLFRRELNAAPDPATRTLVAELRGQPSPGRSRATGESDGHQAQAAEPFVEPPLGGSGRGASRGLDGEHVDARGHVPAGQGATSSGSERRQLTILSCRLMGGLPLAEGQDPEELDDLVANFQSAVAEVVARFNGFVAQYLSDGVVVYFGYPEAREHDADQAVRAGLAAVDAIRNLSVVSGSRLQAAVGIATGLVVVGDRTGADHAGRRPASGEIPSLAARLQAFAGSGEVLIAESTRRLVRRLFQLRALSPVDVGLPQPIAAWRVRGEAPGVSRFEARLADAPTLLVGRREEIELLLRRWDRAKVGEGQVVVLSGEPGIGKSHIVESFLDQLSKERQARVRFFCSPHHTHSPLHPFISQLEQAAGIAPGDTDPAKRDKLSAMLRPLAGNLPRDLGLIAELLRTPTDEPRASSTDNPQHTREMTLCTLLEVYARAAAQGPNIMVVEDAHWMDPTSLDLLDRMVARAAKLSVLLLITVRPEFQPAWVGQPHVTTLHLSRLGRRDSAQIVAGMTPKALPDVAVEQILDHADGVPLFIEELTSALIEGGVVRETVEGYALRGPLPALAIPTTLQASLSARLDRLGPAKNVAQIGAAIGRAFSHDLICAVADLGPQELDAALERLTASGLISRRGAPPDATYTFKHALVQDAAYGTMLKSRRQRLHASLAKVLVQHAGAQAEPLPEVIARHLTEAGLASEAVGYWVAAGRSAALRSANHEAVSFFEAALAALEQLPETRETRQQGIDLRFDLRTALVMLGDFEQIFHYLHEAERLATALGDQRRLGETYAHMCHNLWMAGRHAEALAFGQKAQAIGASLGDVPLEVMGSLHLGAACLGVFDYRRAETALLTVVRLLDGDLRQERFGLAGFPAVLARSYLTWVFGDRGEFEAGIAHGEEGIRRAEAVDHPYSLATACWYLAHLHIARGDFTEALGLLERSLGIAREWNLTHISMAHPGSVGHLYALSGRPTEAIPLIEQAVNALDAKGLRLAMSFYLAPLAEAYLLGGRIEDARACAERALSLARDGARRSYEASALRLLGDVALCGVNPELAERHYRDALAIAETLGVRPLAAHCHLGLGKLYWRMERREQAVREMETARSMYRSMGMANWLKQAEAEF